MLLSFHLHLLAVFWVSMQLFFVLSGFLITTILVKGREEGFSNYIKTFYARRALRIFPAYFAFLALYFFIVWIFNGGSHFYQDWQYILSYTYNLRVAYTGEENRQLSHLWSLAVEEQFYLVWPFVIYFIPKKFLPAVFMAVILLAPLGRYIALIGLPEIINNSKIAHAVYKLPTTHMDAFACGALVAVCQFRARPYAVLLGLIAILLVGALFQIYWMGLPFRFHFGFPLHMRHEWQSVWGYSLWNILWASMIVAVIQRTLLVRFFESRVMAYFGKLSYAIYLVHVPIMAVSMMLVRYMSEEFYSLSDVAIYWCFVVVTFILCFLLASLSYHFFERPILKYKDRLYPYRIQPRAGI